MDTLLTSMELTAKEAKKEVSPDANPPKYPWGLCINLDEDALKKLGIDELPDVGSTVSIVAKAEVQSASESQYQGDKEKRMSLSLQITDMGVKLAPDDDSGALYPKSKTK
jgi:hypothetical protein